MVEYSKVYKIGDPRLSFRTCSKCKHYSDRNGQDDRGRFLLSARSGIAEESSCPNWERL